MTEKLYQLCVERPIVPILVFFFVVFASVAVYEEIRDWLADRKGKRAKDQKT